MRWLAENIKNFRVLLLFPLYPCLAAPSEMTCLQPELCLMVPTMMFWIAMEYVFSEWEYRVGMPS